METVVSLTERAKEQIRKILPENKFLKVKLSNKGCSGFNYTLDFVDKVSNCEIMGVADMPVVIEEKELMFLLGTEIDYKENLLKSEFTFKSPLGKSCGCGKSVSFSLGDKHE